MGKISEYINSGIIESFVLGLTTPSEAKEVEKMAAAHKEVRVAINEFGQIFELQALSNAIAPDPIIKPMLMATINYIERMGKGEPQSFPPMLHEGSQISDYFEWLSRPDMQVSSESENVYARVIGYTPKVTTAIIWIENMAPEEVHTVELEKFLIVEGTCEITIEKDVYKLAPGDFFQIPLFKSHTVRVTSNIACKAILQRVAA